VNVGETGADLPAARTSRSAGCISDVRSMTRLTRTARKDRGARAKHGATPRPATAVRGGTVSVSAAACDRCGDTTIFYCHSDDKSGVLPLTARLRLPGKPSLGGAHSESAAGTVAIPAGRKRLSSSSGGPPDAGAFVR
jgi:hypothetical protein